LYFVFQQLIAKKSSKMDKWVGKVAVVTGASAGIGAALFKDMANAGITVVGFARRQEKVEVRTGSQMKCADNDIAIFVFFPNRH
jgi:NADP-dependent 3-hydroxy acid dehydrogenase YdfG